MQLSEVNLKLIRAIVALQEAEVEGLLERAPTPYKVPSPAQLRAKLSGKAGGLTKYAVERLRKDFLTLMKNLKRVKTYDEAERVKKAVFRWRDHYEDIISQIGPEIDGLLRVDKMKKGWERKVNEGWAKEYRDNQSPIWLFRSAMWDFPLTRYEKTPKWGRAYSKEELFADYQEKYKTWERRVRRKSQAAWRWLRDLVDWTESRGPWGGGGEPLPIRHPGSDVVLRNIAGFPVQLRGYDPDDETRMSEKWMGQFERGLTHYKQRAQRVMPWLIKYQLPLVLHFVENKRLMGSQSAATYSHDHINVNIFGMSGTPGKVAKVLAHEMGHHLYQSVLSQRMRDDWKQLVTGEQTDLDLRKVLAMRTRDHDGDLENELHFERRIRKENPTLALQLATLMDDPRYKDLDLWSLAAIEKYLEKGGNPILKVSARPITGYAAKNPEEAFCEAIGLLVGFGPRALLPIYRAALKKLFPELKVESKGGLSGALQEALS